MFGFENYFENIILRFSIVLKDSTRAKTKTMLNMYKAIITYLKINLTLNKVKTKRKL